MTDTPSADRSAAPAPDELVVLVARPRRTSRVAVVAAAAIAIFWVTIALLLHGDRTGVYFRPADQVAMAVFGLLMAGAVLLLARPRLRAGAAGIAVRNVLGEKLYPWEVVEDVSFPPGSSFARIELPDDEYATILALQSTDGERAVTAMDRLREMYRTYGDTTRSQRDR
ncbi:PH domain-containing protein [Rhodococcus sp. X156]|uniref:PH domain-containing protein n=1 Tax=Rhodococcus sp. X156 TaxID=2499145 RepID=UPI000FD86662|nr:PH domain-containing protein [Rhodococcus sp. X156]